MSHPSANLDLFLQNREALVHYAVRITGCRARAEDVVQDAYLRFANLSSDPIRQPLAYLRRIVRNLALDDLRRGALDARVLDEFNRIGVAPQMTAEPEDIVVHRDELRQVAAALADLPERTCKAFEMYRFDGLTLQAIADALGLSVAGVHRLVREALLHCARRLDRPVD
ncbi:sigma-70 family RNA polymerase sigma factor [Microvirga sp. VF16]|uniref:sigma-70 family RNA polymerase sigma factor n=1 Tax=Microvirga sp. VF16 TaxID=2807101 RepID=UPI00193E3577|nr:sigma-70 family RNA polymerase sigma factor [Microvirga sp. VF16]QRM32616.1 sigma-70 family RNA polymerase sigma factor [Microvirga sp. VF16]